MRKKLACAFVGLIVLASLIPTHEKKARVRIRRPYRARIIDSHRGAWERATRELFRAADTLCSRSAHRDGAGTGVAF